MIGGQWSVVSGVGDGQPSSFIPHPSSFDLLTVIAHELGHVLGLGHTEDEDRLMAETLPPGVRRLPLSAAGIRFADPASAANRLGAALWPAADELRAVPAAGRRRAAEARADAGLVALLDDQPAAWAPADEEVARLTAAPRKQSADPEQRLDEVLSSVGDWLDPLDEILRDL